MSDLQLSSFLLNSVINYGAPAFAAVMFLSALGVPSPATFAIIAVGAMARLGLLDSSTAVLLGLLGVIIGDSLVYGLGRLAGKWSTQKFSSSALWQKAQAVVDRHGGAAIYLTRWLITAPAIPVTLVAATSGVSYWKFLAYDAAGELTWIILFGGLGYTFGSQWEQVAGLLSTYSGPIVAAGAALVAAFLLLRYTKSLGPAALAR